MRSPKNMHAAVAVPSENNGEKSAHKYHVSPYAQPACLVENELELRCRLMRPVELSTTVKVSVKEEKVTAVN
jgi:hypothetical protein